MNKNFYACMNIFMTFEKLHIVPQIHSPAISYVTTFLLSKAGDNEVLFLDYSPYRYLCQGNLLSPVTASTYSGVSSKTTWL